VSVPPSVRLSVVTFFAMKRCRVAPPSVYALNIPAAYAIAVLFRPHEVRTIAMFLASDSLSTRLGCANTAERIEVLLGGPGNIVLDWGRDPARDGGGFDTAFAGLLRPFVVIHTESTHKTHRTSS